MSDPYLKSYTPYGGVAILVHPHGEEETFRTESLLSDAEQTIKQQAEQIEQLKAREAMPVKALDVDVVVYNSNGFDSEAVDNMKATSYIAGAVINLQQLQDNQRGEG